jgi:signal transduction histidine kinase
LDTGDAVRLEQVVSNLVDNALKYGGNKIELHLSLPGQSGEIAELKVCDDGVGIDADELPRLFTTSYQASPGFARSRGGLGLGPAVVKQLVELHGALIRA